jgi:hypothetical protein
MRDLVRGNHVRVTWQGNGRGVRCETQDPARGIPCCTAGRSTKSNHRYLAWQRRQQQQLWSVALRPIRSLRQPRTGSRTHAQPAEPNPTRPCGSHTPMRITHAHADHTRPCGSHTPMRIPHAHADHTRPCGSHTPMRIQDRLTQASGLQSVWGGRWEPSGP